MCERTWNACGLWRSPCFWPGTAGRRRDLPWRENRDPYRIWVSEIMLQQTRVEAVKPYFERFMEAFPGVKDLAEAEDDRLMKMWEGLGYYSRARNSKGSGPNHCGRNTAAAFLHPSRRSRSLPGIGSYTAGAVASIAYGIPVPAVDGNVLRVVSRVLGDREDIRRASAKGPAGAGAGPRWSRPRSREITTRGSLRWERSSACPGESRSAGNALCMRSASPGRTAGGGRYR